MFVIQQVNKNTNVMPLLSNPPSKTIDELLEETKVKKQALEKIITKIKTNQNSK